MSPHSLFGFVIPRNFPGFFLPFGLVWCKRISSAVPIFLFSITWRLLFSRQDVSPPMSPQSRWDACVRAGRGPGAWARGPDPVPPGPEAQGPGLGGRSRGPAAVTGRVVQGLT